MISSTLILLFLTKHLVVDFFWQPPFMFLNKGDIRHPGGYAHAGLHALFTMWILVSPFSPLNGAEAMSWALLEGVIHYAIDWSKVNITNQCKYTPANAQFWNLLGIDQYLHYLTYWFILINI